MFTKKFNSEFIEINPIVVYPLDLSTLYFLEVSIIIPLGFGLVALYKVYLITFFENTWKEKLIKIIKSSNF